MTRSISEDSLVRTGLWVACIAFVVIAQLIPPIGMFTGLIVVAIDIGLEFLTGSTRLAAAFVIAFVFLVVVTRLCLKFAFQRFLR